jgi:hypothetical protein
VVPELTETVGLPVALGLGALLVVWYLAGNELMRRRSHRLALWSRRIIEPLGGSQSIRWLGGQAFRLEVDATAQAPFRSLHVTGLVEAWDVPIVWAWNRLHGRRDMILLQATLRTQPLWGLEVYRPGTILAGDSRHLARQESWPESPLDDLRLAAAGDVGRQLAAELVQRLDTERARLVRLAVRRQAPHLTLALNVPDPNRFDPETVRRLTQRLAERIIPA